MQKKDNRRKIGQGSTLDGKSGDYLGSEKCPHCNKDIVVVELDGRIKLGKYVGRKK